MLIPTPYRHSLILLATSLFLIPAAGSGADSRSPSIDDDVYTTHRQIDWSDFRGRGKKFRGAEQARIATLIELDRVEAEVIADPGGGYRARPVRLRVYALMHKLESAFRRGGRSDWALAHEQAHFDITELHARRLRRTLEPLEVSAPSAAGARQRLESAIEAAYERALGELEAEQRRYDGETVHGTKKRAQRRWWKEIEARLADDGAG